MTIYIHITILKTQRILKRLFRYIVHITISLYPTICRRPAYGEKETL